VLLLFPENNPGNITMKILLMATAVIEIGAGVALMGIPSTAVRLLLDSPLDSPAALILGRVAGAALFALGVACWLAREGGQGSAARGLVAGMLFYNVAVLALLVFAAFGLALHGELLWPATILHGAMAVGCFACLRCKPTSIPVGAAK
jgi:hypothetical protein